MATRGKKEKEYPPMPANWMYKRGDVYMMDLNPYSGSEQGGIRPAIVVPGSQLSIELAHFLN